MRCPKEGMQTVAQHWRGAARKMSHEEVSNPALTAQGLEGRVLRVVTGGPLKMAHCYQAA